MCENTHILTQNSFLPDYTMNSVYTKLEAQDVDIESCDDNHRHPSPSQATKKETKRRSCLGKCCCILLVLLGVLVAILTALGIYFYIQISFAVKTWTTTSSPIDSLPIVIVPEKEISLFKLEGKAFVDSLSDDTPHSAPSPFVVKQRIVNGLANDSEFLKGHLNTIMKTNEVTIDISLPMDKFPGGKGRYLVGKETFVWNPNNSEIHTKLVLNTSVADQVFYDAKFSLTKDEENGRWDLELLSGYFAPMDIFSDGRQNLLKDIYECDSNGYLDDSSDDEYDMCVILRNVLNGIGVDLKEEEVVFTVTENGVRNYRRLLERADWTGSNMPWKVKFYRRLAGF